MAARENLPKSIGNRISTSLVSSITNSALSLQVTDSTGINTAGGYIVVDYGVSGKEEVMYVESRSSNTLNIATDGRGLGGTSAVSHDAGATVQDVLIDEHINNLRAAFLVEHDEDGAHTLINSALSLSGNTINSTNKAVDEDGGNTYSGNNLDATDNKILDEEWIKETDGWIEVDEVWTYASADDPTFTFTITGDKTGKYSAGMRVKLTQTSAKYFIITKVAYSNPSTTITVYGGTDYDLANAAITSPYYSREKAPVGFPLDVTKWRVALLKQSFTQQLTPTGGTWYNIGSRSITVPIGIWRMSYRVNITFIDATAATLSIYTALSTTNNGNSDAYLQSSVQVKTSTSDTKQFAFDLGRSDKVLNLASKTAYYLNVMVTESGVNEIDIDAGNPMVIIAECAYL